MKDITNKIDTAINELVYDKFTLQKAYNYYNGKRDLRQYQYLEENFGIPIPSLKCMLMLIIQILELIIQK